MTNKNNKPVQKQKRNYDSWLIVTIILLAFYAFFMLYPMVALVKQSFTDKETGVTSLVNYLEFFNNKSNVLALQHSFKVSVWVTVFSLVLGVPLAYFTTCYKIKGSKVIRVLIILSSMSPPFVGAFSWVVFAGNNGILTRRSSRACGRWRKAPWRPGDQVRRIS